MFSLGDEVIFKDEEGEGVVISVLSKDSFLVLNDLGFEIQYTKSALILKKKPNVSPPLDAVKQVSVAIEIGSVSDLPKEKEAASNTSKGNLKSIKEKFPNDDIVCGISFNKTNNSTEVYWELFLLNLTRNDYYYTIRTKQDGIYILLDSGIIAANSSLVVSRLFPIDITELKEIVVQALILETSKNEIPPPVNQVYKIKAPKLYNQELFFKYLELQLPSLILKPTIAEAHDNYIRIVEPSKPAFKPTKKISYAQEKEIDLHIEKLHKNHASLPVHEILELQLRTVKQVMDEAIVQQCSKVTFIHGVGDGILKKRTRQIVASYQGVTIEDGHFGRYKFGATTVFFN